MDRGHLGNGRVILGDWTFLMILNSLIGDILKR